MFVCFNYILCADNFSNFCCIQECVSDKKEVNEPGTDVSMEVPHLRNVQVC